MNDETKVYIASRPGKGKSTKTYYTLRWIDPATDKWKSKRVGTASGHPNGVL